ncbi:MAG: hypothetical protein FWE26_05130 [Coriobacteriia bacterium]|nr:hypothetical protein [Coriobacteriia bacterium]
MTEAKVWRCCICGDSYLGYDRPTNCPFCGAHAQYILPSSNFPLRVNDVQITESERADLEYACDLEVTNLTLYKALGEMGDRNGLIPSAYRALGKIEHEHLSVFGKLLKVPVPTEPKQALTVQDNWTANIELSHQHEEIAAQFYREAAERATTPRVKIVFTAIAEVEEDHIAIDNYLKSVAEN